MLSCGDTFLTGDGDENNFHLWIIITPPAEGEVVTVCVVTAHRRSERLVVLQGNDHPFITRESVIDYFYSKIRLVDDIETLLKNHLARSKPPASNALLKRIQIGLLESDFTPNGVKAYYRAVTEAKPE